MYMCVSIIDKFVSATYTTPPNYTANDIHEKNTRIACTRNIDFCFRYNIKNWETINIASGGVVTLWCS